MIDWAFIGTLEGRRFTGYIPDEKYSQSGVTVACGVDLGNADFATSALPADLLSKLSPYMGLRGMAAETRLNSTPLVLTPEDCDRLDQIAENSELNILRSHYLRLSGKAFDSMPDAMQTVVASVAFQYGNLWERTPEFWRAACEQDEVVMISELKHFGDRYTTRRLDEANYLETHHGPENS